MPDGLPDPGHHRPGDRRATYLAVIDIQAARRDLTARGVKVSDIRHKSPIDDWRGGFQPGADPARRDYGSFADFADPDGNTWVRRRQAQASGSACRIDRTTPTGTAAGYEAGQFGGPSCAASTAYGSRTPLVFAPVTAASVRGVQPALNATVTQPRRAWPAGQPSAASRDPSQ